MKPPPYITHQDLENVPHIRHGFFTRQGGVSEGIYCGLNCGFGSSDGRDQVAKNRSLVAETIGAAELITVHQTHSATALSVTAGDTPRADAMATNHPNLALGILGADCAPILFADRSQPIIAAAHAGWRGAVAGITDAAIARMTEQGAKPENIIAVIGPHISAAAYEVKDDMRAAAIAADPSSAAFFAAEPTGQLRFDLSAYIAAKLKPQIGKVAILPACTFSAPDRFFSHRYNHHRALSDYGRQISVIMLVE